MSLRGNRSRGDDRRASVADDLIDHADDFGPGGADPSGPLNWSAADRAEIHRIADSFQMDLDDASRLYWFWKRSGQW